MKNEVVARNERSKKRWLKYNQDYRYSPWVFLARILLRHKTIKKQTLLRHKTHKICSLLRHKSNLLVLLRHKVLDI